MDERRKKLDGINKIGRKRNKPRYDPEREADQGCDQKKLELRLGILCYGISHLNRLL